MAAAAPTADAAAAPAAPAPKKKGKLLIIIAIVVVVVLLAGGAAAFFMMKKKSADQADEPAAATHSEAIKPPTFHPLEVFTVNLADRDRDRFLQVNISLEVADTHVADRIKAFNPAIRDRILMLLSSQTAEQLSTVEGKEALARNIVTVVNRVIAGEFAPETSPSELPVHAAHFSSFVVQ